MPKPTKIVFICAPYTGDSYATTSENIYKAREVAKQFASYEIGFLCPHANSALMQDEADPDFWYEMYLTMLEDCDAMFVLPGWGASSGCQAEVAKASKMGIPVFYDFLELLTWAGKHPTRDRHGVRRHTNVRP